ncbi:MAG TPA: hypothetical protein P5080_01670 [Candidatus Paceibacterota bacterium]|nr:hypothetical protein [Candidatus Pacearchaeota archaeon]HRZ50703.1 hypothetical protein [Candidatus Paceibacterota bacterium]HSA36400.1 hypothetical protein [Candidatus Paceibacterota bacterium]
MGLQKFRSHNDVDLSDFDIQNLDLFAAGDKNMLAIAEKIFAMIASLVYTADIKARPKPDQKQRIIERDIGHQIKARFKETFADACVIRGNIDIHHHIRTKYGLGDCAYNENIAWAIVGGVEAFQAQWDLDSIDARSLFISTSPEAKGAFAEIREKWLELSKDSDRNQQS